MKKNKTTKKLTAQANRKFIPKVLSHEEAITVYKLLFPFDNGRPPCRPDILFSLEGKWKGWKEILNTGSTEDEIQKNEEDASFIKAWEKVFK